MSKIYVISDTHFCHDNILNFEDNNGVKFRGSLFKNSEEMDETIVKNWNEVVQSDSDIVYHLGDVYFKDAKRVDWLLSRLRGRKRLLLGNHDRGKDQVLMKHFQKVGLWRIFKEYDLCLSHIPLHPLSFHKFKHNVHGHIHQNPSYPRVGDCHWHNVSVERTDYRPVEIEKAILY